MRKGYQEHEAEEAAQPQFILLKSERPVDDWESREAAALERKYQKMMKAFLN